jgi:hypothetical protein
MTNSEAYDYATKDMLLGEAGTRAFYKYVSEICEEQATWEARAESAIRKDRQTGKSPDDEARRSYLLDSNKGLWILTQRELANLNPSSTPQDIRLITQKGYCSGIEAGIARDIMSALTLLEYNNGIELTLLAELGRARESSYLKFVTMANLKAIRDKLLQLQEVIPTLPASCHFRHYSHNRERDSGDCVDQAAQGNLDSKALQRWGLRA